MQLISVVDHTRSSYSTESLNPQWFTEFRLGGKWRRGILSVLRADVAAPAGYQILAHAQWKHGMMYDNRCFFPIDRVTLHLHEVKDFGLPGVPWANLGELSLEGITGPDDVVALARTSIRSHAPSRLPEFRKLLNELALAFSALPAQTQEVAHKKQILSGRMRKVGRVIVALEDLSAS